MKGTCIISTKALTSSAVSFIGRVVSYHSVGYRIESFDMSKIKSKVDFCGDSIRFDFDK